MGGGVVTDLGAFAASTFKRGIDFVQVPTTLLSMVDASIGGKTGIDFKGEKNMVGTFTNPKAVFIQSEFLKTLPIEEVKSGISEMIKHGLIADREIFNQILENLIDGNFSEISSNTNIYRSINLKNKIVLEDPLETGNRKLLNFGHTIGHAIESLSLKEDSFPLNHGASVAIGMICESYLSTHEGNLRDEELKQIIPPLLKLIPNKKIKEPDFGKLWDLMSNDKKNKDGKVNFTFLKRIGEGLIDGIASQRLIYDSFNYYNSVLHNE